MQIYSQRWSCNQPRIRHNTHTNLRPYKIDFDVDVIQFLSTEGTTPRLHPRKWKETIADKLFDKKTIYK